MSTAPEMISDGDSVAKVSVRSKRGRWLAVLGVVLYTGPVWGIIGTIISMRRAFSTLGNSDDANVDALSGEIGSAVVSTAIGISVGMLGSILVVLALLLGKNREKWFFWSSMVLSSLWCLALFPRGLVVGLLVGLLFFWKRAEFSSSGES